MKNLRCYLEEGTEIGSQIIDLSGRYILIFGTWCWDSDSQEGPE